MVSVRAAKSTPEKVLCPHASPPMRLSHASSCVLARPEFVFDVDRFLLDEPLSTGDDGDSGGGDLHARAVVRLDVGVLVSEMFFLEVVGSWRCVGRVGGSNFGSPRCESPVRL